MPIQKAGTSGNGNIEFYREKYTFKFFRYHLPLKEHLMVCFRSQGGDAENNHLILGGEAAMWSEQARKNQT
jgi:hypothetical protein